MKILNRIEENISKIFKDLHLTQILLEDNNKIHEKNIKYYKDIIDEQNKIIQNMLKSQLTKDFECIVYVPYRGKPVVIKNGEVVSTDDMTSFDIDWAFDRRTDVTVRRE